MKLEREQQFKVCPAIYIFTNKINGKIYVGETVNLQKRMMDYNNPIQKRPFEKALRKYGIDGFQLEYYYLPYFDKNSLLELEEETIKMFQSLTSQHGYNVCARGNNTVGYKHNQETKNKISDANKGKIISDEHKRKISETHKGKIISDSHKQKISNVSIGNKYGLGNKSMAGKNHSEESKRKMSESRKGREGPNKGRKLSDETKRKMSESRKGRKPTYGFLGKKHTDETKRKMSESQKYILETDRKEAA